MATKTLDELLADLGALTGDKSKLKAGATLATDLVTAANANADLVAQVATLTAEKTKLTTDLATANGELTTVKAENATLKASAKTVEQAVAAKLTELGITDKKDKGNGQAAAGDKKLTLTQKCLKANGHDINEKVALGSGMASAANSPTGAEVED